MNIEPVSMNRNSFLKSFYDACRYFKQNECVKLISKSGVEIITYEEIEWMMKEISSCFKRKSNENQCIGIVCNDLNPQVIAIIMGIIEIPATFVFIDPRSTNVKDVVERLNIQLFVCEETCICHCMTIFDLVIEDYLSCTTFFKRFRILERKNSSLDHYTFEDIAFVAFSSGSTGRPKIIRIPFSCILPNVLDLRNIYKLQMSDTIYVSTPPTFDPCILDIFLVLSTGCTLLITAPSVRFEEDTLSHIFTNIATICFMTPSVFSSTFPKSIENTSLRILIMGGEPFPHLDPSLYPCLKNVDTYNIYGITEVSCWASINLVVDPVESSLGTPLSDTIFKIQDEDGNAITDGVGELFIGSFNRICQIEGDETPLVPCFRASGDIVEIKDGKHFYVGRTDRKVKIFGHQVNLASVDAEVSADTSVKHCYSFFNREENLIVIFICPISDKIATEVFENIKLEFPFKIFTVPHIPLNKHGKICKDSCSQLYHTLKKRLDNNIVHEFESLWEEYTMQNSDDLGFIECGGNSILALQLTTALSKFGQIPNDFIVALLSNVKYSKCRELILQVNDVQSRHFKRHSLQVLDVIEDSPKKMKSDVSFGDLEVALGRGTSDPKVDREDSCVAMGNSENMKVKWKHDMVKCVDASPMVFVYENISIVVCGSHSGQILFVNVDTGELLNRVVLPDRIESSVCISSCGKNVFIGCYDHKLYCIGVPTGIIKWTFATGDMVKCSPAYFEQKLYFGSYDHYFYCVSQDGQLLWKTNIDESSIYASSLVGKNIVVTTLGGTVAFLEHGGSVKFRQRCGKPFFSSPLAIARDLCVTIDVTGTIRLFNVISGKQMWQYQVGGNVFSSVSRFEIEDSTTTERIVFGCHDEHVYCFEVNEAGINLCWCLEMDSPIYATPFYYQYGAHSLVCVATTAGRISVVNSNGAILKSSTVNADVFSSPVVIGSTAIFGCRDNYLYALDIS